MGGIPGVSPNLTLRQKMVGVYRKVKNSIAPVKPNPAAVNFPPLSDCLCGVQLLNQCMEVTGTRYLIAREALGDSIKFGHSNTLNGTQWVAAFEQALQRNGYDLIGEKSGVVKLIPKGARAKYENAGLLKRRK
jgi:hypothetical protein